MTRAFRLFLTVLSLSLFVGCGWQDIPRAKNDMDAKLAELNSQYKRRADLIPNLVSTVKGYAKHEEKVLTEVTEARAKATSMTIDPSRVTPEQLLEFQRSQGALSAALGRLLAISENYPNLKADVQFRDLAAQLEGTENRIAVARNRLIESINAFNNWVTVPPYSWTNFIFYRHGKAPQWDVSEDEKGKVEKAPAVGF